MYGFVNHALELLVVRNFGVAKWEEIKRAAELEIEGHFLQRIIYDDVMTYSLVGAATRVLDIETSAILEKFGEMFFDFCQESGYDRILQVLGGTLRDFIGNLDALHDHLGSIYPGMRAPSFRVSDRESDGALILHYYSERDGLEPIVVGIVKTVARKLLNTEVSVEVVKGKEYDGDDVQFVIKEISDRGRDCDSQVKNYDPIKDSFQLSNEPKISPATFCKAFPFHLMFNRDLKVTQAGESVSRVVPSLTPGDADMSEIFELIRPQLRFTYEAIIAHINTVFVLRTREGKLSKPANNMCNKNGCCKLCGDSLPLRLKGQMVYIPESDNMIFLCSPSVGNLEDLADVGLYLSDIPLHDATKDLILLSEQFKAEYVLTQQLEILTDKLRQTHNALAEKKQLTDQLLYSVLPPSVANELRHNRPVQAERAEMVTLLFSGIVDFAQICKNSKPMEIVMLLNNIYTKFDMLTDPSINDVYKVETVGDKYMAVSGLPERCAFHARSICNMALDMKHVTQSIIHKGDKIQIKIGIHSGEVVAGVVGHKTPRYCLFGNTVNLTSRTETTGAPGQVNITEFTYRCLLEPECQDPSFVFERRGPVAMKGRQEPMVTYLLTRDPRHRSSSYIDNLENKGTFLRRGSVLTDQPTAQIIKQSPPVTRCPITNAACQARAKIVTDV
ncbi:guanylate cyclase soluble subunit beta-1 [Nematostella vectensis]|uniref:guanylate cyclase soluble subunit beta-1 n=1 Tax=Nematostella vectensis TaxID=45351 RepID=UPI00207767D7|nr:guanylate cyclase soluble subunit beta-1 [Nematostella vectensis]